MSSPWQQGGRKALRVGSCAAFVAYVVGMPIVSAFGESQGTGAYLVFLVFVPLWMIVVMVRDVATSSGVQSMLLCCAEGVYVQVGLLLILAMAVALVADPLGLDESVVPMLWIILSAVGAGLWFALRCAYHWLFAVGLFQLSAVWSMYTLHLPRAQVTWSAWDIILVMCYVTVAVITASLFRLCRRGALRQAN